MRIKPMAAAVAIASALLAACGGGGGGSGSDSTGSTGSVTESTLSDVALLGEKLFNDTTLSSTGKMSCASCHAKDSFHAPFDGLAVQPGAEPGQETARNSPSLRYLRYNTSFSFDKEGTPTGGFTWDGRSISMADQARGPLLAANEMANTSIADVVAKLSRSPNAAEFRRVFGADILSRPADAFDRLLLALQKYQQEDPDFAPFSSKFDLWLAGKVKFSEAEARGWALFNDPNKGNCAACHVSTSTGNGVPPLFTDFTYDAVGAPRNTAIKANADAAYYDLGLCGPTRQDLTGRTDLCGAFKVPSLRNVAKTGPYFHNGVFKTLVDTVRFYIRRDTHPEEFYPLGGDGLPLKFNDLPPEYRKNVNTTEAPYNRTLGDEPALNEAEIADLVTFLETLTDGYQP